VATIITSLEEVISNRKIRKRSANLVRFRNQTVLTKAVEDLKRLSLQAKELTELNPTARDRYEATLWEMAADIFEDSQAVDRQA
jgi:DNA-binding ferritin-like protein